MTEVRTDFLLDTPGTYRQPTVHQPRPFQNANNARYAIWHLGRMVNLLVYPASNHKWQADNTDPIDDGRHERGEPVVVSVRAVWQPNSQKRGRGVLDRVEASRSETNFVVHIDSHDPVNLANIAAHPIASGLFPNGLRLYDFDDFDPESQFNFPSAIEYRGVRYKIKQPLSLWEGGDEDEHADGAIYRAECQLWIDRHHEREARGTAPVWGPQT